MKEKNHNGLQSHTGRVDDLLPFRAKGSCVSGGIYFTDVKNICAFLGYGPYIREVIVPEDAQMVQDPDTSTIKYRASSVILGERERWDDLKVFTRLLKEGADVHINDDEALREAAYNGRIEIVKFLLDDGADVHANDDEALRLAAKWDYAQTVELLLKAGADVHAKDDYALRWASEKGNVEVVKLLLEAGADVHVFNDEALHLASRNGHTRVVKLLLDAGANAHRCW